MIKAWMAFDEADKMLAYVCAPHAERGGTSTAEYLKSRCGGVPIKKIVELVEVGHCLNCACSAFTYDESNNRVLCDRDDDWWPADGFCSKFRRARL